MLTNHLKSAWRNIWKRKEFSLINLLGLSIGMAACLLILQYVQYEMSYDDFHDDLSGLYRVNLGMKSANEPEIVVRATNHPAVGPIARQDFPQVEEFARLVDVSIFAGSSVLLYKPEGGQIKSFYEENMFVADSTVLQFFDYPLVAGDPLTALSKPTGLVISESTAKRYFGHDDPMGKTLSINGDFEATVTGVLKDLPDNTHLKISALFSSALFSDEMNNTWIWPEFYTYVKLAPNTDVQAFESQLDGFVNKYLGEVMAEFNIEEKMYLQPVNDIHLNGNLLKEAQENGNKKTVSFLILIAAMILLIAWINYINLSTSRSMERASEVGIRKVVGAHKKHLISQFLVESALMNLFAILLAVQMVVLAAPSFNRLVGKPIIEGSWMAELLGQSSTWAVLAIILFGGTLLAGLYPAFVLSSFKPAKTIKGKFFKSGQKFHFRHAMVVFQFMISLLMIVGTMTVFHQLSFMRNQDLGFNMDQILVVKTPSIIDSTYVEKIKVFRDKISQNSHVGDFTASSDIPGHIIQNNNSITRKGQSKEEAIFATYLFTDEYYVPTYELNLIAGKNFTKRVSEEQITDVILNKKAIEQLGFNSPEEAIGKIISRKLNSWDDVKVAGVVENINHRSLAHGQEAFVFFNRPIMSDYYSIKINTKDISNTIANIENTYKQVFPLNPFDYFFLDDYFNKQYLADQRFGQVFSLFAGLAILVACLGLFGLVSYITARRTKEIGVRKILGASTIQILILLGKQFMWLVLIAATVAIPIAWWGGDQWLNNYAYRAELNSWIFIVPILIVMFIALLTILWQSSKAAHTNPVHALRTD